MAQPSIHDATQFTNKFLPQFEAVRGSGVTGLIVYLKYGRGRSADVQRILNLIPRLSKEFLRLERDRLGNTQKIASRNSGNVATSGSLSHTKASTSELPPDILNTYHSPKHDRVYCKQCDSHLEGFCGEHELQRQQDNEHEEYYLKKFRSGKAKIDIDSPSLWVKSGSLKEAVSENEEDLHDNSTLISRDSGYVSRMSNSTTKPPYRLPQEAASAFPKDWDLRSVASLESHATDVTMSSINPTALGGAAEEVVEVLVQKAEVRDLIAKGFQTMDVDRFERNFRRLLKEFAINLQKEAQNEVQKSATQLVHSY
jgi:hypothetical protein